jgi:hypothetical protein
MIHKTLVEKIADALGFIPAPPGELTQQQLQYIISQIPPTDISGKVDKETGKALLAITEAEKIHSPGSDNQDLSGKQDVLVSGTNIKTINGTSILGSGNLPIEGGSGLTQQQIEGLI